MDIFLHVGTNLEYFKILNEGGLLSMGKSDRDIAKFFMDNFPGELAENISPQYEVNFSAIRELKKKFWPQVFGKIWGIYYWSDNCEYLAANKVEVKKAYEMFLEFNKVIPPHKARTFTFVTPYVGDKMMVTLEKSLEYLNEIKTKTPIEVVVNDFWVLSKIEKNYKNLKPVFWRLLNKVLKTPLIDTYWFNVHPAWELIKNKSAEEIEELKNNIRRWQMKFYASSEASLPAFRGFLDKYGVSRVALDFMEKRKDLFDNSRFWDLGVDLYYPWAVVMTWRLCDTSAIENEKRGYYAVNEVCPRTCFKYDVFYKIKTDGYNLIQRWNAWFRSELNLDYISEDFTQNEKNRLIFAPFITV